MTPEQDRLLTTLERLLEIEVVGLKPALDEASDLIARAIGADKVDVFLYEAATESLVAVGTSDTPMGRRQRETGLNRMPLANGGPTVNVFRGAPCYVNGHADRDPDQIRGVVEGLGIRSEIDCRLYVDGEPRGILQAASGSTEAFSERDVRFLEAVSRWVGMVAHRAELVERMTAAAMEQGRRAAADELISLLTPRQREIAALIASGLTNEQIAARLVLTKGTVANHVEHILDRLGAKRRAQIAAWITEQALRGASTDGKTP